ncbi:FadR/GntR family transcriptional regulator [Ornithinimicrobium kibberense]|uniref:FadR/GntR family transcriptional regulator n=1 Tax=Ornithinimicrobium kibberense TaxID=282060 RepID=A0ABV5V3Q6_9MICO|nr:FCD domain-containing protein [Ornithinimicrobium kibberense]
MKARAAAPGGPAAPRAYETVVAWVEERILDGRLQVGDQLPAERDLAARLEVSRAVVREAVRSLQAQGVLAPSVGAGRAGGTRVSALPSGAMTRLLRLHVALAHFPLDEVVEVRTALERLSARLAATRATDADLALMRSHLEQMRTATDRKGFNDGDTAFHVALAQAAGNGLAADTTEAIREALRRPLMERFTALDEETYADLVQDLDREHETILEAVATHDPAAAEVLAEAHVRTAWRRLRGSAATMAP